MTQPLITPGRLSGSTMRQKMRTRRGAEVGGGSDEIAVEPIERDVDRQRHEQRVDVDKPKIDRAFIVEQPFDRPFDEAGAQEKVVDDAGAAEDGKPHEGAD